MNCPRKLAHSSPARMSWARLLKRVFDIDIEHCPNCGARLKIIAAIEEPPVIVRILAHLGYLPGHRRAHRRSESICSKRRDRKPTPVQPSEPTMPLGLGSSNRLTRAGISPLKRSNALNSPRKRAVFRQTLVSWMIIDAAPA